MGWGWGDHGTRAADILELNVAVYDLTRVQVLERQQHLHGDHGGRGARGRPRADAGRGAGGRARRARARRLRGDEGGDLW